MTLTVKHGFTSGVADDPTAAAAGEVLPSHWNANHTVTGTADITVGVTQVSSGTSGYALTNNSNILGNAKIRTILSANTNYYVSATGSDSNGGTNSSTDAWATLTHAMHTIASTIDIAGFTITINIGAGTFVGFGTESTVGGGNLYFKGAGVASTFIADGPNDGVINFGNPFCIELTIDSIVFFDALTFQPVTLPNSNAMAVSFVPSTLYLGANPSFGPATLGYDFTNATHTVYAVNNASPGAFMGDFDGTITVTGGNNNAAAVILVNAATEYFSSGGTSWTVNGALGVVQGTIYVEAQGTYITSVTSWSGTNVTGPRFKILNGGTIGDLNTTLGPTFFPGSTPGTCDASSSYDGFIGPLPGIDTQTGASYTLALSDAFEIVEMNNAGANTVTIPSSSTVNFEVGTKIWVTQTGAGATATSSSTTSGVVLHNFGAVGGQWKTVKLYKRAADEWVQTNS